ncbi:CrcB family protein [Phycisphaerales bacterium AB-hyl4]|uniref:Fluoride-specific ion channel FluC n=1 Tax=Natronomicrosphaera hydrolytica TaxID=3242702 RepID=A0ABV4U354_9BACT
MTIAVAMLVAVAGGGGAVCRYVLDYAITQHVGGGLPWGTWLVNVTGSLGLGVLVGLALVVSVPVEVQIVVGGGFLGAYTTFSTWIYESLRLFEQGAWRTGAMNLVGSIVTGGIAAAAGLAAMQWWV